MSITPFTIVLLLCYVKIFLSQDRKIRFLQTVVITMICSIVIYMGYVVKLSSESTIPFSTLAWLVNAYSAYQLNHSYGTNIHIPIVSKKVQLYLLCLLITIVSFYFYRYDKPVIENSDYTGFMQNMTGYAMLSDSSIKYGYIINSVLFCYIIYTMYKFLRITDLIYVGDRFIKYTSIVLVFGFVEFIMENFFNSLAVTNLAVDILGSSGVQQIMINYDRGWSNIQVFTKEASMFSASMLYSVVIAINMIILNGRKKIYLYYLVGSFLLMILNTSMSSYVYVCLIVVLISYLRPFAKNTLSISTNSKFSIWIFAIIVLLLTSPTVLMSDSYLAERLNESLAQFDGFSDNSFTYSSEGLRYFGIYHCLSIFVEHPLFGVGYGCVSCVSGIVTLLTNAGIIGLFSYIILVRANIKLRALDKTLMTVLLIVGPNLLLNDLHTMFALVIPFTMIQTGYIINAKNTNYEIS